MSTLGLLRLCPSCAYNLLSCSRQTSMMQPPCKIYDKRALKHAVGPRPCTNKPPSLSRRRSQAYYNVTALSRLTRLSLGLVSRAVIAGHISYHSKNNCVVMIRDSMCCKTEGAKYWDLQVQRWHYRLAKRLLVLEYCGPAITDMIAKAT